MTITTPLLYAFSVENGYFVLIKLLMATENQQTSYTIYVGLLLNT